ncbi:MAG: peptide deformylase [Lachnospiraceae bacterium]|nr:peptide deformylase [Lachnospiraceae bacterium]
MAIRQIRVDDDEILRKRCKPVKEMTPRIQELIDDMFETMYENNGVGLAAPQVGVLKRIVVIDLSTDDNEEEPYCLINPELVFEEGEQEGEEGCLSVPGKAAKVVRPNHVIVKALNEDMEEIEVEGFELLARALCHELDHLDGIMYTDLMEPGTLHKVEQE